MPTSPLPPSTVGPSVYIFNPSSSSPAAATQASYPSFFSSGGGLQATRLAALDAHTCFVASHHDIFGLDLSYPAPVPLFPSSSPAREHHHQQVTPLTNVAITRLPPPSSLPPSSKTSSKPSRPPEIQSLCLSPNQQTLAAIDSAATVLLYSLPTPSFLPSSPPSSYPSPAPPGDFPRFGWAGLAFHPHHPSRIATVRTYGHVLSFLDLSSLPSSSSSSSSSSSFHALWDAPTALAYLSPPSSLPSSSSSLLAVAEGSLFSLWDERCASPCVAREQPLPLTRIVTLGRMEGGEEGGREGGEEELVVVGEEGVTMLYDLRNLVRPVVVKEGGREGGMGGGGGRQQASSIRCKARWRAPVKHNVVALLSGEGREGGREGKRERRLYTAGVDSELLACVVPRGGGGGGGGREGGRGGGSNGQQPPTKKQKRRMQREEEEKEKSRVEEAKEGGREEEVTLPLPPEEGREGGREGEVLLPQSHAPLPTTSRLHEAYTASVRADARWVGIGVVKGEGGREGGREGEEEEVILGVSGRGTVYVVRHAERMGGGGGGGGGGGKDED